LRFSGGGADIEKRRLRAAFLGRIFERLGFEVTRKSDLIDAKYGTAGKTEIAHTLDMVGRLLGATRLMDMYLKDETMVDAYADEFMQGRYHFSQCGFVIMTVPQNVRYLRYASSLVTAEYE
jgi:pyruvate,water dikinase